MLSRLFLIPCILEIGQLKLIPFNLEAGPRIATIPPMAHPLEYSKQSGMPSLILMH